MFNLVDDPAEQNDLSLQNPERINTMTRAFAGWANDIGTTIQLPIRMKRNKKSE